ncbi:hypothetical protein OEZ85_014441 [Tetradesmus obliquus]|uniref:PAS domain-containing protein n=1 Tax=Tetradesmus obliquus TaxID=3088 RepID=A0ABY8U8E2_TETOB|nr:hypothetical protein OEZ85_014441 [Tetradesmus obliquus]WIA17636.1 hypothetical protein OEZ85_014441 [Tetradesmus obliquus]
MERQDSVSSMGSAASGMSAASSMAAADGLGGGPGDVGLDQVQTIAAAVFGVLGTLFKERWEDSKRYLALRFTVEHLQLLLILLQPHFGWKFHYEHWGWQVPNYLLVKDLIVPMGDGVFVLGDGVFVLVMYAMVALAGLSLCGCGWICYTFTRNGFVPNKWPVKLLRLFMVLFYQVFYITILNFVMGNTNCNWLSSDPQLRFLNVDFYPEECRHFPHIAQLTVACVFSFVFIAVAGLFALADVTPNPVSQNWLATAHAGVEVKTWVFKTLIVVCANALTGHWKGQVTPILIFATWIFYVHVRWQPYYFQWMNHIRCGLYAMTAFVALMLSINAWWEQALQMNNSVPGEQKGARSIARAQVLSQLVLPLLPAAVAVGVAVSWLRLNIATRHALDKFRALGPVEAESVPGLKDVHKFVDPWEVEIIARCCRRWTDYEDKELDQGAVKLAEMVIKAGLVRFPHSGHMVLIYVNFLGSVANSQQACSSQLQAAKKLEPSWLDRYVIFVRDQQQAARLQQHSGSNMESALDLVGYVEFQHSYRQVLKAHKTALYAQRSFWKVLLHSNVSFSAVVKAFRHIEATRGRADKTYQTVLERYPTNVKVLRAYARFLEDVKNDPWSASKYYTEADKLEEQEGAEGAEALSLMETAAGADAAAGGIKQVDEKTNAVCVINATGTIQMANKVLLKMFGYRKGELEGKNVALLMPQPYSGRHNGYLRNFQTTGQPKILDKTQEMVALHKEHYVFPVTLGVTRVSGTGAEAMFMGVMRPALEDAGAVKAWIMPGGIMLCVDARFTDWFGKSPVDCVGRPLSSLAVDGDALTGLVERAMTAKQGELEAGLVCLKGVALTHKYADPVAVDITIEMGGTDAQRLLVSTIRKTAGAAASEHLMVTDHKGRICYVTSALAALLGSSPKALLRTDFARLMAQPFMQLHAKWMKDMPGKIPAGSCRAGAPVVLISASRVPIPAKLDIAVREQGEDNIFIVKVTPCTFPAALDSRRLSLTIDSAGTILEVGDSPAAVFGFAPGLLLGRNVSECVDVFRGLPQRDGPQGLDVEHVLAVLVHKVLEQKDASWRCGVHPPMTAAEVAAAQAHVIQANMLASRTKAALLSLEVTEHEPDEAAGQHEAAVSIVLHLWRAEMLMGVVEVDKEGLVAKAGCCALHQPGPLLGISSNSMLRNPLSRWLNVPGTYEGLLLDAKKKGALKRKAADVKVGPLRHARGVHYDGDPVHISVQAVVKEGGGPERLVVKLGIEKPAKGHPDFARQLLGLAVTEAPPAAAAAAAGMRAAQAKEQEDELLGAKSVRARGGVTFGAADADAEDEQENAAAGGEEGRGSDDEEGPARSKKKNDRVMDWVRQASGLTAATTAVEAEESLAGGGFAGGLPPPPDEQPPDTLADGYLAPPETNLAGGDAGSVMSGGDGASSAPDGSEAGAYESDFKRGKRLRRLARMLNGKQAQKAAARFYKHACLLTLGLFVAHTACFAASVSLINAQNQYIQEVDDAGAAVITLHRMAIDCRVLDALHKGIEQPGIFTQADLAGFSALFEEAIDLFHTDHERTYLGRTGMRRFVNRQKYKLRDYWESNMWNATNYIDTVPPVAETEPMGLWELGNWVVAAAREVLSNHERMTAGGVPLSENRFWRFVMDNGPWALYNGYKLTLYGLVERAAAKMGEVSSAMVLLLVLEGCVLFISAAAYITWLISRMVSQRANLFSVFLVIPTGFLRALASKQVVLDEDADSDEGSDAGDPGVPQQRQQEGEGQDAQKVNLSIFGKKANKQPSDGGYNDFFSKQQQQRGSLLARVASSMNPLRWFGSGKGNRVDTGKKQLVRNSRDAYIVAAPYVLWAFLIIFAYLLTIVELKSVQGPFRMLNSINFLVFRVTRGVLFALEICMAPDAASMALRKQQTVQRLRDMQRDYTSFLYGFDALGPGEEPDDLTTYQAAVFQNADLAHVFFRTTDCLRKDQAGCYPVGHPFYDVSRNGLDAMATRFMQETQLLLADDPRDINVSNARLRYIWQLGRNDLFDGMQLADKTFRAGVEEIFAQVRVVHEAIFALSLIGAIALWLGLVRPTLRRAARETAQIAEMLSQLPPEMDVEGIIAQVGLGEDEDDAAAAGKKGPRQGGMAQAGLGGGGGYSSNHKRSVDGMMPNGAAGGGGGGNRRSLHLPALSSSMPGWS